MRKMEYLKFPFCREAGCQAAVSVAEGISLVSTISHIGFYIYCSTSPGMFSSCPQKSKNKGLLDFPLGQIPSTPGYSDVLKAMEETYGKICLRTSLCHMRLPHLFHGLFSWWEDRRTSGSPQGQMFAVSLCSGYRHSTELRECLPPCSSYGGTPRQAIVRSTVSFHSEN